MRYLMCVLGLAATSSQANDAGMLGVGGGLVLLIDGERAAVRTVREPAFRGGMKT